MDQDTMTHKLQEVPPNLAVPDHQFPKLSCKGVPPSTQQWFS